MSYTSFALMQNLTHLKTLHRLEEFVVPIFLSHQLLYKVKVGSSLLKTAEIH